MKATITLLVGFLSYSLALPVDHLKNFVDDDDLEQYNYMITQNEEGKFVLEDLLSQEVTLQATEKDVTLRVYTRENIDNGEIVTKENITSSKYFKPKKEKTLFIIHGWRNNYQSSINKVITTTVLNITDINVIVVDWSGPANKNYITAQKSVKVIGKAVGDFINNLVKNVSVSLSHVVLIGHSLGAHVSGNAGAAVEGDIDWIIGLDPARPLFTYNNTDNRLDPTDAEYVYIIHTSGGLLGFQKPIGDCDFFPNGGEHQPGCGLDIQGTCGHSRAYEYYAESLTSDKFVSKECSGIYDYRDGKCKDNRTAIMGQWQRDKSLKGSFYLEVNSKSPYAKG